jgi:hypothetical protein
LSPETVHQQKDSSTNDHLVHSMQSWLSHDKNITGSSSSVQESTAGRIYKKVILKVILLFFTDCRSYLTGAMSISVKVPGFTEGLLF